MATAVKMKVLRGARLAYTFSASQQTQSQTYPVNGMCTHLVVVAPNLSAVTIGISVQNKNGDTIYSITGISNNTTTVVNVGLTVGGIPFAFTIPDESDADQITVSLSSTGQSGTIYVTPYFR